MEIIIHTENFKSAAVSHMIVSSMLIHVRNKEMKWVERQKRRKTEVTYERRKEVVQLWVFVFSPDIYCCGLLSTRKSDCTGLPQSMLVCGSTPAQRGQSRVMMKGSMSLISWYNKGHFRFLTNSYSPTKQGKWCSDAPATKTLKEDLYCWIINIWWETVHTVYALMHKMDVFIFVGKQKCAIMCGKSLWVPANLTVFKHSCQGKSVRACNPW